MGQSDGPDSGVALGEAVEVLEVPRAPHFYHALVASGYQVLAVAAGNHRL